MTDDSATPAPAPDSAPASAAAHGLPWKRYAIILGVVLLALGAAWLVFGERFTLGLHITGLHSNDGRTRAAHVQALKDAPNKELVIELLGEAVDDDTKAFEVRKICADLLHRHFNRLPVLERLLRTAPSVHTRGVVLRSLMVEPYFMDEIVTEPAFRVPQTIDAWLQMDGDLTRSHAIQLAVKVERKEAMPLIRPLLQRSGAPMVHKRQERDVMIAAAGAVERFADCESLPMLLTVAGQDEDFLVRLRYMQIVDRACFRDMPLPVCPGMLDEDLMAQHVRKALDDPAHELRMGAMLILVRKPAWAKPALARLREIVAGPKMDGERDTGAERRHALETLVRVGEAEDIANLPMYFHDASVEVRSTAARSLKVLGNSGHEGCWIGQLEDETESQVVWNEALDFLYKWVKLRIGRLGFPPAMSRKAVHDKNAWAKDLANLFAGQEVVVAEDDGTFMRISRASIARDHFRWWARHLGLEQDDVEKAEAARTAFYAAKRRGDAKAAQAALEGAPRAAGLWNYEDAWLATQLK
ncbi:MAG: hypothetical protein P1V36_06245 [Planctomycetota bacterium]|nr:hypothetical protein [Planctomycetota bacterium]